MTSSPSRRYLSGHNRSTITEELDRVPSVPDTTPVSQADTNQMPRRLSIDEMFELWKRDQRLSKLGAGEAKLDSVASEQNLQSSQSPAIQHRGWLFRELRAIQNTDIGSCTLSSSTNFSSASRLPMAQESSSRQLRSTQKVIVAFKTEIDLRKEHIKGVEPLLSCSSRSLKAAGGLEHLHLSSVVKTESTDNAFSDASRSVQHSTSVHCRRKESSDTFVYSAVLAQIFPYHSLALLEQDSSQCISTKSNSSVRCIKDAKSVISAAVFANAVAKILPESHVTKQLDMIESLASTILCTGGHHQPRARRKLDILRCHMSAQDWTQASCEAHSGPSSVFTAALASWLKAISSYTSCQREGLRVTEQPASPSKSHRVKKHSSEAASPVLSSTRSSQRSSVTSRTQSPAIVQSAPITSSHAHRVSSPVPLYCGPQNFQQWRPRSKLTVPQLIRQALEKPIGERSQKPGYVYIYWNPGNFGYVKIGFTASTVEKRLTQWARGKCNHGAEEYAGSIGRQRVPYAYRVECLVLAELRDFRLKESNCPCGRKEHQEWCNIAPQHVAKVRRKWENFMLEQQRYESRVGGQFLRCSVSNDELEDLCRPLPIEKPVLPNTKKASSELRRSPPLREKARGSACTVVGGRLYTMFRSPSAPDLT